MKFIELLSEDKIKIAVSVANIHYFTEAEFIAADNQECDGSMVIFNNSTIYVHESPSEIHALINSAGEK